MSENQAYTTHKMNSQKGNVVHNQKFFFVAVLVIFITILHFLTEYNKNYQHIIFRESYFVPLILAGFWFGLRGALITSLSITVLYSSFTFYSWQGFSAEDFSKIV